MKALRNLRKGQKILLAAVFVCILCGLLYFLLNRDKGFFIWMDGYITCPVNTEYKVAFTYYYQSRREFPVPESITAIQIPEYEDVQCKLESYHYWKKRHVGYWRCGYVITFQFPEAGEYTFHTLKFIDKNGNELIHDIGNWTFIAIRTVPGYEIMYSGTAATSNNEEYPYEFGLPEEAELVSINYGPDQTLETSENRGRITLDASDAPVKVIRPKLVIKIGERYIEACGTICYCGSEDVSEEDVELSKARALEQKMLGQTFYK